MIALIKSSVGSFIFFTLNMYMSELKVFLELTELTLEEKILLRTSGGKSQENF